MEFTNEIFFNKNLAVGSTVIITYFGKLYREHSKDISIVYGYGDNWDETESSPMIEKDNGFEATITLKDYNTFNFCFTNSFNIWDNNSGFNYIAPIAPKQIEVLPTEEIEQKNQSTEEDQKNDDDTPKADGLNNDVEEASATTETTQEIEEQNEEDNQAQETDENKTENSEKFKSAEQNEDIEAVFASLLDSLLTDTKNNNETIDISNLTGFGLQSVDEINEEDMINCDEIFAELFEELTDEQQEQVAKAETDTNADSEYQEIDALNYDKYDVQELDSLMDNLLTSISDNNQLTEPATPIQTVESQNLENEQVGLPATIEKEDWVDKFLNISYHFTKKITTACKKLGSLIKIKAKEFGIINDNK